MSEYIHHVCGRLRLKLAQIKKNPGRAKEVQTTVCRITGVIWVEANTVTGSLLIRYDAARVEVGTILNSMREAGLLAGGADTGRVRQSATVSPLAEKVVGVLVEKLIERSAIAVLGALL